MANAAFKIPYGVKNGRGREIINALREERIRGMSPAFPVWWETPVLAVVPKKGEFQLTLSADASTSTVLNTVLADYAPIWPNIFVLGAVLELVEAFAGGSVSACTAELGDAGDPNGFITATDVFTGAAVGLLAPTLGVEIDNENARFESAFEPTLTLTATGGNTNTLTAGKVRASILCIHKGTLGLLG